MRRTDNFTDAMLWIAESKKDRCFINLLLIFNAICQFERWKLVSLESFSSRPVANGTEVSVMRSCCAAQC